MNQPQSPKQPANLDLLYTELEDDLRSSVSALLADKCDPHRVKALYDGDGALGEELWPALAGELGLAGLLVPEDLGGAGATTREAAVVLEEIGRYTAPVPFLTSAVVATTVLLDEHATEAARALVGELAAGEKTAALLVPFSFGPDTDLARAAVSGGTQVRSVAGALEADVLLVPVAVDGGLEIRAVAASSATVDPVVSLDMSRPLADVTLAEVTGDVVVPAGSGNQAVRRALLTGAALLASEQLGVAQWCLTTTLAYLKERRQFGRVLGGFQALKHRLADMFAAVESAGASARYAAAALAAGEDEEIATRVAASFCSETALDAAEDAIQLHGGIGMTWEHSAHHYLKRAKSSHIALGTPGAHRAALADLVELPAS
ncbi:acyl-CoA dehydrogenase family protein [Nocardioides insulae]|uniref:acyl-CoA dehydrogenase family protein n=1 Tax=Nocardioides insulae TaxID=394734 RepID=UPI0004018271|nr:acyl-CoA dehydrogenase family protein [Nocardioides insulae]